MAKSILIASFMFLIFLVCMVDSRVDAGTCDCMCTGNYCSGSGPTDTCTYTTASPAACTALEGTCDGYVTVQLGSCTFY
jgi:hypothetical protein